MNIAIDTHSHTLASGHAYSTIREMARAAADRGHEGLAITEHAPTMSGSCKEIYFANLKVVPRNLYGIELLFGVELNILDEKGTIDLREDYLKTMELVIASIHPPCFKKDAKREDYMNAYIEVMKNPYVNIIGHPDDSRIPIDYERLVQTAAERGKILEVNNSSLTPGGFRQNAWENVRVMLELCRKYKVWVTLASDAHFDTDAGNVCFASQIVEECGFPEELVVNTSLEKLKKVLEEQKKKWNL